MPWNDARSDVYERAEGDIEPLPHARRLLRTSTRSTPGRRSCNTVAKGSSASHCAGVQWRETRTFPQPGHCMLQAIAVHRRLFEQNCCERGSRKSSHVKPSICIYIQTCTPSSSNCGSVPHDVKELFFPALYVKSMYSGLSLVLIQPVQWLWFAFFVSSIRDLFILIIAACVRFQTIITELLSARHFLPRPMTTEMAQPGPWPAPRRMPPVARRSIRRIFAGHVCLTLQPGSHWRRRRLTFLFGLLVLLLLGLGHDVGPFGRVCLSSPLCLAFAFLPFHIAFTVAVLFLLGLLVLIFFYLLSWQQRNCCLGASHRSHRCRTLFACFSCLPLSQAIGFQLARVDPSSLPVIPLQQVVLPLQARFIPELVLVPATGVLRHFAPTPPAPPPRRWLYRLRRSWRPACRWVGRRKAGRRHWRRAAVRWRPCRCHHFHRPCWRRMRRRGCRCLGLRRKSVFWAAFLQWVVRVAAFRHSHSDARWAPLSFLKPEQLEYRVLSCFPPMGREGCGFSA